MRKTVAAFPLLLVVSVGAYAGVAYEPDRNHSTIGFGVPILDGISEVTGKFTKFTVAVDRDPHDDAKSTVRVVIDASSVDTGIDGRDKHLRSADFFDVEKFPEIVFESTRIRKKRRGYVVDGNLSLHGVTKVVSIPLKTTGEFSRDGRTSIGLSGTLTLDRRDFGVAWKHQLPMFISDRIAVRLSLLLKPAKPSTAP